MLGSLLGVQMCAICLQAGVLLHYAPSKASGEVCLELCSGAHLAASARSVLMMKHTQAEDKQWLHWAETVQTITQGLPLPCCWGI